MRITYSDREAADALLSVIGESSWLAVCLAHGMKSLDEGKSEEGAAKAIFSHGQRTPSLKNSRLLISRCRAEGIIAQIPKREKVGSAENALTKLFPAAITERRFIDLLDTLCERREGLSYTDDRETGHTLVDFILKDGEDTLPINIKNAGTPFQRAKDLVGLDPDDCIPIPAYKAHAAVDTVPNLLYVVSVDYDLLGKLDIELSKILTRDELIVWDLLNKHSGSRLRDAEDKFVYSMTDKYWPQLQALAQDNPFHVVSARKAIRILHTLPERTPGIGLRAWGTGASAEVNVHISIKGETKRWSEIADRIASNGVPDIIQAVNRKKIEEVYDPEI